MASARLPTISIFGQRGGVALREWRVLGRGGAKVKSRAAVAAMARDPPEDAYEYTDGEEETPPPVLFANPIGEDYFVRGFNGDSSYQWDDEWDDDAPSED